MSRRAILLTALGAAMLGAGWLLYGLVMLPMTAQEMTVRPADSPAQPCRITYDVIEPPPAAPASGGSAAAAVFHGLGANRRIMVKLGQSLAAGGLRVYLFDLPGHGPNRDPFRIERAEACAAAALEALAARGEIDPQRTALVGHSLGGALAIRLADRFPTAATVALSAPPMIADPLLPAEFILLPPPHRAPSNLLLVRGQLDIPAMVRAADRLLERMGLPGRGQRAAPEDFAQRRAARLVVVPRATHGSLLIREEAWAAADAWWRAAIPGEFPPGAYRGRRLMAVEALGGAGLMFLFAGLVRLLAGWLRLQPAGAAAATWTPRAVAAWAGGAVAGVLLLHFFNPLRFVGLYQGDYLAAVLLVTGAGALAAGGLRPARPSSGLARGALLAAAMALLVILGFGWWLKFASTDTLPGAARWLRLAPLAAVCLPFALAEEALLGAPQRGWRALVARGGRQFLLRMIVWVAMLAGAFVLGSGQVLLLVMVFYMGGYTILARLGTDAVWRQTGSAPAAALFNAILSAWFVAGVFPLQ